MSSSPPPGITGYIATNQLSSFSLTWSRERGWLVIAGREPEGIAHHRSMSLQDALERVAGILAGNQPEAPRGVQKAPLAPRKR
jgi:hypothetical protein